MEQRLDWISRQPANWMHWEPMRGSLQVHALLTQRYPRAGCWLIETDARRMQAVRHAVARPWWRLAGWRGAPQVVQAGAPDAGAQMVWANMALHMSESPTALLATWQRALAVDGFLMFSCFGPDTLRELRGLYRAMGWPAPAHEFTDMHDWGDMLLQTGFSQPVMDMERIELTFETPRRLLQELRGLGRNLHVGRFAGLRTRQWHERLIQALGALASPADDGRLKLTFEVIYGHAIKAGPRVTAETAVSLEEMKAALLSQRKNL